MLTKDQEKFLRDNEHIFKEILPLKKKALEESKQQQLQVDKHMRLIKPENKEKKELELQQKKIKDILNKMTLADINKYEELLNNVSF